jgi:uncharacterized damage-inducible protein DinB
MKTFFEDTFAYSQYANEEVIKCCATYPDAVSEKVLLLLSHVVNAHSIWIDRVVGVTPNVGVWQKHELSEIATMNASNAARTKELLQTIPIEKRIEYRNTKGDVYENSVGELFFHIINHSTYHRGQIITKLKEGGAIVPATDYIFYKR